MAPKRGASPSLHNTAMNLLARREHSRAELRQKLIAREFEPADVEVTIKDLAARDLVSDERFAESYTRARSRKGYGPVRIRKELQQRGVSDDLVQTSLANFADQWDSRAYDVRRKKFGSDQPLDFKEKARQMRFLEYRGFTTDQITSALKTVLSDSD